jgi:hypothetical protein
MRRTVLGVLAATALATTGLVTAAMGPAHATAPGSDGLIAFVRQGDIFTAHLDGSHLKQLTHHKGLLTATQPKWSPDGKHIAYVQEGDFGRPFIWEMSADGSHKHKLWKGQDPAWSPNGKILAFVESLTVPLGQPNTGCDYAEVWSESVAGGGHTVINNQGDGKCFAGGVPLDYGSTLSWSKHDGLIYAGVQTAVYAGADNVLVVDAYVEGMHPSGSDAMKITNPVVLKQSAANHDHLKAIPAAPTVDTSPIKGQVVYSEPLSTDSVDGGIVREENVGNESINLISEAHHTNLPVYSPNGKNVLFVQHTPGTKKFLIKRIALSKHDKTTTLFKGSQPDWQPTH